MEAIPKSWWSWDYMLMDGPRLIAVLDLSNWREKGQLEIDGMVLKVHREGFLCGPFLLESSTGILAKAEKTSPFQRVFMVQNEDRCFVLKAKAPFSRAFEVLEGSDVIGSLKPTGFFTRKAQVNLPDTIPLPVRVFMVWLTIVLWKRSHQSSTT